MAFAIDTNIFIYGHCKQFEAYKVCHVFLEKLVASSQRFYLSYQVYYEYLRVTTHPKILKTPLSVSRAHQDIVSYFGLPQTDVLRESSNHLEFVADIFRQLPSTKANFVHDCHYAALLKENGISTIITADMDFKKFDFLKVINPITDHFDF